ncbi:E3 ubiquitin-protein ligase Topors [Pygocentrus nattereri]|uniref:E3 ubiquitin-protein ligase Topors n=1 Tax=Pygocentrus nattereri TaxID=42514 RepID=A0A3B4DU50_PYGNA|nr:E3 ubiquitin-protein ligase Topors [Pygocentrus nattereri]
MLTRTMMTPTKMKLRVRKKESGAKSSRCLLADTSPDSKCPICLDRFNNVASLDRCLHRFCFRCIHEWSKNKAECPLCKQPFRSIFHSVKAENDFKEFVLAPVENGPAAAAVPPAAQTDIGAPSGRVRRPRAPRGGERRSRRHQNPAATASSLDLRLENLTEGMEETVGQEQGVHHMMLRLTERRRSRGEERSLRRLRDQDVVAFRRALYRTGIRVRSGGWDSGRQRDVSAAHLRRNPASLRRLLPWLQRELTVLYGSHGSLVSIVQHIIMSRITHYDMDDAAIRDELRPFLLARTDHFLHELVSFARSTLSIETYDQQAVYECPAPSYEEDSGSDSSIIAISEDDDDSEAADITEATEERVPPVPMATGGESSLSQSGWDDETPGPSYSTLFPSPSQSQADGAEPSADVVQADEVGRTSGADGPNEDEEEECMIVGYVKPMAERTPELVQLSSDSSEEEREAMATEMATAATLPKAEASSSQAQAPLSPESYRRPLSPSSCPCPSASRSPGLNTDRVSPQNENSRCSHSGERDAERHSSLGTKEETRRRCFRDRSQSCSDSSVLSRTSGHSRSCRRSGSRSRRQERSTHRELQRWSCQSSGLSPTVSVASDSSDSSRSPSWERPQSRDRKCPKKGDEEQEHPRSVSVREKSSQSSICWDSPVHGSKRKKARKRRRHEKERERSRSPLQDHSASHGSCGESRRRHGRRERRPRAASHSSSRSSSSSEDSQPDRPCPEKPAGKRKYKTRHLERAAQRQSSRRSSRDRERREARSSPAKRHHRGDRERSRSPSVEIIFERRASDPPSHTHRWKRKRHKRRSRREARPLNSPTIITIESGSDTNDYQDCVTEVTSRTTDYQQREVSSSKIRYQGRVIKAAVCKTDDQPCTDVNSRTTEDQHLVTKVTNGTTDDQHSVTSTTSDAQHHVTKITDDQCRATVVVDRTADPQHRVTKVPESKTDHRCSAVELPKSPHNQCRVNSVTDNCHRSVVDVTDYAVDCQDSVVKSRDPVPETPNSKIDSTLSLNAALPGSSLESYSPVTPTERLLDSPDCALNLEKCVVDVVDRESFDHSQQSTDPEQPGGIDDLSQDASLATATPPSDTRLLESILQELEDILPEERREAEPGRDFAAPDSGVDRLEDRTVPPRDQSDTERERTGNAETSDPQRGAAASPAV